MPKILKITLTYYGVLCAFSLSSIAKEFELESAPKGVAPTLNVSKKGVAAKVPSLLGLPLKTKDDELEEKIETIKAPSLKKKKTFAATQSRQSLPLAETTPSIGDENADVTLVYYTDLGCSSCRKNQQKIYDIYKKYKANKQPIKLVHKYMAEDPYSTNNIASFYGRIAHKEGVYWDYFEKLMQTSDTSEENLRQTLLNLGVSERLFQYQLRPLARELYKNLDNEQYEAKQLNLSIRPAIFVNGVLIGGGISFNDIEDFIDFEFNLNASNSSAIKGL